MAVFEAQISAQVTQRQKDELAEVLSTDREHVPGTSEGDVIRAAIEFGLRELRSTEPEQRCQFYAFQRRGLPVAE